MGTVNQRSGKRTILKSNIFLLIFAEIELCGKVFKQNQRAFVDKTMEIRIINTV